ASGSPGKPDANAWRLIPQIETLNSPGLSFGDTGTPTRKKAPCKFLAFRVGLPFRETLHFETLNCPGIRVANVLGPTPADI
ncbi:hypothetical protein, partial [Rosistilla oblonga]|uniref:hypothetical protein n=1 Tax=Rosistilla oblonga TaxID=2527990 RepID=UPI003A97CE77